jgi:hypothetical protein
MAVMPFETEKLLGSRAAGLTPSWDRWPAAGPFDFSIVPVSAQTRAFALSSSGACGSPYCSLDLVEAISLPAPDSPGNSK